MRFEMVANFAVKIMGLYRWVGKWLLLVAEAGFEPATLSL